jgi:chloramphenicol 3-O-phosphotransferase|tara:strand:- start:277 stop:408 length:132 start_codon:yes stop_codon:yes gene_type:complete
MTLAHRTVGLRVSMLRGIHLDIRYDLRIDNIDSLMSAAARCAL